MSFESLTDFAPALSSSSRIGEDTASPYAKQSIRALRESLPNPTLVVLERQEHNAMDSGREALVNAIIKFTATKE